jgi:hypothetical protein
MVTLSKKGKRTLPEGRVRGGRASQTALETMGLRTIVGQGEEVYPRSKAALDLIAANIPGFTYKASADRRHIDLYGHPRVRGEHPSLADLARYALREPGSPTLLRFDSYAPSIQKKIDVLGEYSHGEDFGQLLLDIPAVLPPRKIIRKVGSFLDTAQSAAQTGEEVVIFSPVCPDYAVAQTGDPERPYEYTFDGLGTGIGLVAQRILNTIPQVWDFFSQRGMNVRFVVAVGDFEADSKDTLDRVGLSKDEFVRRVQMSQQAFLDACPKEIPVEVPLMTEVFTDWDEKIGQARQAVENGHYFGALKLDQKDVELIAAARKPLYERWYGRRVDAVEKLLSQAPEYMATGACIEKHYPNSLILGADAVAMAGFLQGLGKELRPVVYLKSSSY